MKRYISKLRSVLRSNRFIWKNKEEEELTTNKLVINGTTVGLGADKHMSNQTKSGLSDERKSTRLITSDGSDDPCHNPNPITFRHQEDWKVHDREKKTWEDLVLYDIDQHPMLKQELIAIIDGRYIQFRLISVDPKLLQEPLIIKAEPIPSLIWPYD